MKLCTIITILPFSLLPQFALSRTPPNTPDACPHALQRQVSAIAPLPPRDGASKMADRYKTAGPPWGVLICNMLRGGAATCLLNPSQRPLRPNGLPAPRQAPYMSHIARLRLQCYTLQHLQAVLRTSLVTICTTGRNVHKPCILSPQCICVFPICGNKMPTRCNRGFYCRSFCNSPLC